MNRRKYYAVRVGRNIGIFETWNECQQSINCYSNAEYKAFEKKEEAVAYLNNKDISDKYKEVAQQTNSVIAYVDGSYSDITQKYSYGCILITPSGKILKKSGYGDDPRALSIRNVAGELQGAMHAVKMTSELGYNRIIIRHDYIGIAKWYDGQWKAKDEITKIYVEYMKKISNYIEIVFEKVKAHSGDKYNEEADKLAKNAIENNNKVIKCEKINNSPNMVHEELLKVILENIMDSSEVIEYLGISAQKLSSLNRTGKLNPIKKRIYLRLDVEKIKRLNIK